MVLPYREKKKKKIIEVSVKPREKKNIFAWEVVQGGFGPWVLPYLERGKILESY